MQGSCGEVSFSLKWVGRMMYEVRYIFLGPLVIAVTNAVIGCWLAAEQRITPWQDDADVTNCPLCRSVLRSFSINA
jgi:hypothetical protein